MTKKFPPWLEEKVQKKKPEVCSVPTAGKTHPPAALVPSVPKGGPTVSPLKTSGFTPDERYQYLVCTAIVPVDAIGDYVRSMGKQGYSTSSRIQSNQRFYDVVTYKNSESRNYFENLKKVEDEK